MRVRVVREGCIGRGDLSAGVLFGIGWIGACRAAAGSRFGCCGTDGGGKLSGQRY